MTPDLDRGPPARIPPILYIILTMALRRLASEVATGMGLRYGASSLAPMAETSFGLRALLSRGYSTGR